MTDVFPVLDKNHDITGVLFYLTGLPLYYM